MFDECVGAYFLLALILGRIGDVFWEGYGFVIILGMLIVPGFILLVSEAIKLFIVLNSF